MKELIFWTRYIIIVLKKALNIIINGGDILDGSLTGSGRKIFSDLEKQLEYLLKVHPYDKNILNFLCLGNHDYSFIKSEGIDLMSFLNNKRHDIVPLGYGNGKINVKNDQIIIQHPINDINSWPAPKSLIIRGHSHEMKYEIINNNAIIYVPSLSDNSPQAGNLPGAVKMELEFVNGFFHNGFFEHLLLLNNIYKVSSSYYELARIRKMDLNKDLKENIEERTPIEKDEYIKQLSLKNNSKSRTSQIEKFKTRYNLD